MSMRDAFEVFLLVDRAARLAVLHGSSGQTLLDLAAGRALAGEVAHGQPDVVDEELPSTVAECVRRACDRATAWDLLECSTSAHQLVEVLHELDAELSR